MGGITKVPKRGIEDWKTGIFYDVGDEVIESNNIYTCLIAHTSGVFATDLSASKWTEASTLSASEIKTLYESNANTNEFSNAEQTKLAGAGVLATEGTAGSTHTNNGTSSNAARADHEHSTIHAIQIAKAGAISSTGDGQQPFKIRVPSANWELMEIHGTLETAAGTQLSIQLHEMDASDVSVGDAMDTVLSFGTDTTASASGAALNEITPVKNGWYRLDIDTITGSDPEDLTVQLRFRVKTDQDIV